MNKEEIKNYIKNTEDQIFVMRAFLNGEKVQFKCCGTQKIWSDALPLPRELSWDWDRFDYRVKPAPVYIPYATQQQAKEAVNKTVVSKINGNYFTIIAIAEDLVIIEHNMHHGLEKKTFKQAFDIVRYTDGTPFGVIDYEN